MGVEENVMSLFEKQSSLRFSDIEKGLDMPSSKAAHVVNELMKKGIVSRDAFGFKLSGKGQELMPKIKEKLQHTDPHPVCSVALIVRSENKWLLERKHNKPFTNHYGLLTTEPVKNESVVDAALRCLKNKTGNNGFFVSVKGIVHQNLKPLNKSYYFTVVELKVDNNNINGDLKWADTAELERLKLIPTDKWMIRNLFMTRINVHNVNLEEKNGLLTNFSVYND